MFLRGLYETCKGAVRDRQGASFRLSERYKGPLCNSLRRVKGAYLRQFRGWTFSSARERARCFWTRLIDIAIITCRGGGVRESRFGMVHLELGVATIAEYEATMSTKVAGSGEGFWEGHHESKRCSRDTYSEA